MEYQIAVSETTSTVRSCAPYQALTLSGVHSVEGFGEQGVKQIVRRLGLNRPKGPRKGTNRPPE
ncbi:MAG: hypothetical protein M3522_01205, partial [Actinomycetota bacterium]|nr:hypothetical protein [Actinomycetota bacterium]